MLYKNCRKRWWLKNRDKYNERRRLAAQLRSAKTKAERAKVSGASKDQEQPGSAKRQKRTPTKTASRSGRTPKNNIEISSNNHSDGIQQMTRSLPLASVAPMINHQRLPALPTGMVPPSFATSLGQPQGSQQAMFPSMNMASFQWKPSTTPPPSAPTPAMSYPQMVYAPQIGHFSPHVYQPNFQAAPHQRFTGSHPAFLPMQTNFMALQPNLAPGISINHH